MSHYTGAVPDTGPHPTDWLAFAACHGQGDLMFPSSNEAEIEDAKAFCLVCPVISACRQWALDTCQDAGVWGGLSEKERRALRRRAARPISVDDYTTTPRTAPGARTLDQAWNEFTAPDGDHVLWTGPTVIHQPGGNLTPNRLAFRLDRGYWPDGGVKRTCGVGQCVKPAHLTDRRERVEEADLAVSA